MIYLVKKCDGYIDPALGCKPCQQPVVTHWLNGRGEIFAFCKQCFILVDKCHDYKEVQPGLLRVVPFPEDSCNG